MSELTDGRFEVIRRYAQGVETPDYHTLLTDAALMAIEYEAERALADDLAEVLVRADSICSLVAAREPKLLDENRTELRAVALACRALDARYHQARGR
jgi:hypothetical protein